jgi:cell division protein FtsW (lipid II flippase)
MKPQILLPYWCRYLGWGLVIAHIPISVIGRKNGMVNPFDNPTANTGLFAGEHLFFICTTLLMSLGLFLVAFASEKIEDEQIKHIRLNSLRWAIYINYLILIISLVFINDTGHLLELNLWVPLFFFIIFFQMNIFILNRSASREE